MSERALSQLNDQSESVRKAPVDFGQGSPDELVACHQTKLHMLELQEES